MEGLDYQCPEWSGLPPEEDGEAMYKVEAMEGGVILAEFELKGQPLYVVGKTQQCDIQIDHASISNAHAIFQFSEAGKLFLYALKGTEGASVNKVKIQPGQFKQLKDGDLIHFGASPITYIVSCYLEESESEADPKEAQMSFQQ